MKYILIITIVLLSGCSALEKYTSEGIDKGADKIAPLIDRYCQEVNADHREQIRDKINGVLNVAKSIKVEC